MKTIVDPIPSNVRQVKGFWEKGMSVESLQVLKAKAEELRNQAVAFFNIRPILSMQQAEESLRSGFQELHQSLEESIPKFHPPEHYVKGEEAEGRQYFAPAFIQYEPAVWNEPAIAKVNRNPRNRISNFEIGHRLIRFDRDSRDGSFRVWGKENEPLATAMRRMLFEIRKLEVGLGLNEAAVNREIAQGKKVVEMTPKQVKNAFYPMIAQLGEIIMLAVMVQEHGINRSSLVT